METIPTSTSVTAGSCWILKEVRSGWAWVSWLAPIIPVLLRCNRSYQEFKASVSFIARPLKKKKKGHGTEVRQQESPLPLRQWYSNFTAYCYVLPLPSLSFAQVVWAHGLHRTGSALSLVMV